MDGFSNFEEGWVVRRVNFPALDLKNTQKSINYFEVNRIMDEKAFGRPAQKYLKKVGSIVWEI